MLRIILRSGGENKPPAALCLAPRCLGFPKVPTWVCARGQGLQGDGSHTSRGIRVPATAGQREEVDPGRGEGVRLPDRLQDARGRGNGR